MKRRCVSLLVMAGLLAITIQSRSWGEVVASPLQLSQAESEQLQKTQGVHPRLYLTTHRLAELRDAVKTTHAALWSHLRADADVLVRHGPPKYRKEDPASGGEQLWQRDVGNAMPTLAMAWKLSDDRRYLDSARAWALAACSYPTWGLEKRDGLDLAAGHQLFGLAIVYDWCRDDLDAESLATIRKTLAIRGAAMASAVPGRRNFLQNHLWVDTCGLAAAALATWDEVPEARGWIAIALDKWRRTHEALGPDGASHEGVGYWSYGVEYLLKFMWLSRDLLGVNFYDSPWWRNTADYRLYLSVPRRAWTRDDCVVDIADCTRAGWSYGPDYLLRALAGEYQNGHAQWLADELDSLRGAGSASPWLNLLWYDPQVRKCPPTDLPTMRRFDDMEIVSARSDWSGDESLVVFKCGPFIGHKALQMFQRDPGGGHVHPDANHFVAFGAGQWLIRDDGYLTKSTSQHNTLLIDGAGQIGEGAMWFQGDKALKVKAEPRIISADSTPLLDQVAGDATQAYPATVGLKRFVRYLLFAKPDVLIIADDILLESPHALEMRFHPEESTNRADDGAYVFTGKKASLRLDPLTTASVNITVGEDATVGQLEKPKAPLFSIRLQKQAASWRNAVALSWCQTGAQPQKVRLVEHGDRWLFQWSGHELLLDLTTGQGRLQQ